MPGCLRVPGWRLLGGRCVCRWMLLLRGRGHRTQVRVRVLPKRGWIRTRMRKWVVMGGCVKTTWINSPTMLFLHFPGPAPWGRLTFSASSRLRALIHSILSELACPCCLFWFLLTFPRDTLYHYDHCLFVIFGWPTQWIHTSQSFECPPYRFRKLLPRASSRLGRETCSGW